MIALLMPTESRLWWSWRMQSKNMHPFSYSSMLSIVSTYWEKIIKTMQNALFGVPFPLILQYIARLMSAEALQRPLVIFNYVLSSKTSNLWASQLFIHLNIPPPLCMMCEGRHCYIEESCTWHNIDIYHTNEMLNTFYIHEYCSCDICLEW